MQQRTQVSASILLIENDTDTFEVLCLNLLHEGYGVRAVSSRDEALAVLDHYRCDYIIMDLFMPGMGPEDFIDDVNARSPQTEIILVTEYDDILDRARALGIRHCFLKPYNSEMLMGALR